MMREQVEKVRSGRGFFAALDQSGGSTPQALADYGVPEEDYSTDEEMFDLVHELRTRVVTNPAFDGSRVLAAILFDQTMDREVDGLPTATFLWERKQVVPFLKVDVGLAETHHGVQLMKPIDSLDSRLERAKGRQIFGTKMRSVIADAVAAGVEAVVDQQFEYAARIAAVGLVPILEPEVRIDSPSKDDAERLLHDALAARLASWPDERPLMFKVTIPTQVDLYAELAEDPRVLGVLALSGGYSRDRACALLARNHSMIASFSRALLEGLSAEQSDEQFSSTLRDSVEKIYTASVDKRRA